MAILNGIIPIAPLTTLTTGNISAMTSTSYNTMYSTVGSVAATNTNIYNGGSGHSGYSGQYTMPTANSVKWAIPNNKLAPLVINGDGNKEIVRINSDGSVTWADTIQIDEAADALQEALSISVENAAGLTYAVKQRMRDVVFEEIISMAKDKGSLTADDLTYLHQAAKIMDKLKGKE